MRNRPQTVVGSVLVIGSGAAGMRTAIAAHQSGADVVVVGKRPRLDAHTVLASGGINGALGTRDPADTWQQHYVDTVREGYYLSHPRVVEIMAREAPAAILELADWGCEFARTEDGSLDQRFFGAHTYQRTCYAGDFTGRAVLRALHDHAQSIGVPAVIEDTYVATLLCVDGSCFGALAFDIHSGDRLILLADATVVCTGGHTRLWRRSSSRRDENFGDGFGLALEAGCTVMDMELVQFHPTGMVFPDEAAGTLVTEAVRGEGGRLVNADGERYMERYDPQRLELSSRDRVALANYTEIVEGRAGPHGGVFLDISHRSRDDIVEKLPRTYRQFIEYQMLDITKDPMEVAPTAHYSMGGLVVDPETHATEVAGLYAAGEVTGGLHGANRLGGNSLAETVIAGRRAGEAAARFAEEREAVVRSRRVIGAAMDELDGLVHPGTELARPLQRRLRDLMWERCGVVRDERVWRTASANSTTSAPPSPMSTSVPGPKDGAISPTRWTCGTASWPRRRRCGGPSNDGRHAEPTTARTFPTSTQSSKPTLRPLRKRPADEPPGAGAPSTGRVAGADPDGTAAGRGRRPAARVAGRVRRGG
jgi:succinate dehydrogenase / fumarate reductase flavoprotein subunit